MNRRSFLSTLALLPGLATIEAGAVNQGWLDQPFDLIATDQCQPSRDFWLLMRNGADPGSVLHAMRDHFCGCHECGMIQKYARAASSSYDFGKKFAERHPLRNA